MKNDTPEGQQSIDDEDARARAELRTRLKRLETIHKEAADYSAKLLQDSALSLANLQFVGNDSDVQSLEKIANNVEHAVQVVQDLKGVVEDTLKLEEVIRPKHSQTDSES